MTVDRGPSSPCLPVIHAAVTAGEVETTYWRSGTGTTVVLLRAHADHGNAAFEAQLLRLAAACRLIVPEQVNIGALAADRDTADSALSVWLHDFIEGLGLHGASIVGTPAYAEALQHLAGDPSGRFGRIICVGGARTGAPAAAAGSPVAAMTTVDWTGDWADAVIALLKAPQTSSA